METESPILNKGNSEARLQELRPSVSDFGNSTYEGLPRISEPDSEKRGTQDGGRRRTPHLYAGGCNTSMLAIRSLHPERRPRHWYDRPVTEACGLLLVLAKDLAESLLKDPKGVGNCRI